MEVSTVSLSGATITAPCTAKLLTSRGGGAEVSSRRFGVTGVDGSGC
jgi:hypothetical protein